jgi:hypothetical protein
MPAIAAASGRRRQKVWEHFQNVRFAGWFDSEMDKKARAKFAALTMGGSVPHYVALGWSEANQSCVTGVDDRGVGVSHDDGPPAIVIRLMVPRPPPCPTVAVG